MNTEVSRGALLILVSYHHKSTEQVAKAIAEVLDAHIVAPDEIDPIALEEYALIGFGSGIYDAKHHKIVLELANRLPLVTNKKAFIFSTSAIITKSKVASDHSTLKGILESKGYTIVDEFSCRGFNTNSFLKYFGGMNKGRPNAEDLNNAQAFAVNLKKQAIES